MFRVYIVNIAAQMNIFEFYSVQLDFCGLIQSCHSDMDRHSHWELSSNILHQECFLNQGSENQIDCCVWIFFII